MKPLRVFSVAIIATVCAGCATINSERDAAQVQALVKERSVEPQVKLGTASDFVYEQVKALLAQPLTEQTAVAIALLNNPSVQTAMANLAISDAQRVAAATLPNPHIGFARLKSGQEKEFERSLRFSVLGLLTLPWRTQYQNAQHQQAKLAAAQSILNLAAQTRRAWIQAVSAQQSALYFADVKEAASASSELAKRMGQVGNWSALDQAREQVFFNDALIAQARANHEAFSAREKLIRLLGLWGMQIQFELPSRLPDIPAQTEAMVNLEERAITERLDVRAAVEQARALASSLGYARTGSVFNLFDLSYKRETSTDGAASRAWEIELPLPIFDWGGAANAQAQATYKKAVAQLESTAIEARSQVRQAYHQYRTTHDVAVHYKDTVVPQRKFISDEVLLRYNGGFVSVFDLLADMRAQILVVNAAIAAQRDYWLAHTDLALVTTGTSPNYQFDEIKSSTSAMTSQGAH
jgi:outer membrane protein, multidrug efflux system